MHSPTYPKPVRRRDDSDSALKRAIKSDGFFYIILPITLVLFGLFIAKVVFENQVDDLIKDDGVKLTTSILTSDTSASVNSNLSSTNNQKINELTKQLMAEQEKNELLTKQISNHRSELSSLLDQSIATASTADKDYISAMNEDTKKKDKPGGEKLADTDYFNRVEVSKSANKSTGLQSQIDQLLAKKTENTDSTYAENLDKESEVRKNEVRSIVLKKGESIWMIAKRAYGDGLQYHKIMKANPQITENSARYLKPGTIILVPF